MWPGTYSSASATVKGGGNAMFALVFPVILTVVMLLKPKKHKSKLLFNKEENK